MPRFVLLLLLTALSAGLPVAAKKPAVTEPARPFPEAAAAFYPEIQKEYAFYQRWAGTADGPEMERCRRQFQQAILDAFGAYRTARRREMAQTRWPRQYTVSCKSKTSGLRTCRKVFTAPLGQEYNAQSLRTTGRGFNTPPLLSPDRKRLEVAVTKKGSGELRSRVFIQAQRTAADIEREIDRELPLLRKKLSLHNLPSDVTMSRYLVAGFDY